VVLSKNTGVTLPYRETLQAECAGSYDLSLIHYYISHA